MKEVAKQLPYEVYLTFQIRKIRVDLNNIKALVGVEPSECLPCGSVKTFRSGHRIILKTDIWRVGVGPNSNDNPVPHLWNEMRYKFLSANYDNFSSHSAGVPVFSVAVYTWEYHPPVIMPIDFIKTAARMNAEIEVDLYGGPDK
jgi:hypothetical protein